MFCCIICIQTMKNVVTLILLFIFLSFGFAQNGKLLSKSLVDISTTPIWSKISKDNKLLSDFEHLKNLNFYLITYQSDNQKSKEY